MEIGSDKKSSTASATSTAKQAKRIEAATVDYEQLTQEVLQRVNAVAVPKPKKCYICAGDHLSKEYPHLQRDLSGVMLRRNGLTTLPRNATTIKGMSESVKWLHKL